MEWFLSNAWAIVVAFAGGVSVLWGLAKAFGAFRKWLKERLKERRQQKAIPQKTYNEVIAMKDANVEDMRKLNERFNSIEKDIIQLKSDMRMNNDQTATVMLQKMMWSYHYYVLKQNKIPLDVQTALVEMATQYRASGWHNHIPADFEARIQACQIE